MKSRQDLRKTVCGGMIDPLPTNTKTIPVPVRSSTKRQPRSVLFSENTGSNVPQADNAPSGSTTFTSVAQIESGSERQTRWLVYFKTKFYIKKKNYNDLFLKLGFLQDHYKIFF